MIKPISSTSGETVNLLEYLNRLEVAVNRVLNYIDSRQVYDKDAKGILERALDAKPESFRELAKTSDEC